MSQHFRRAWHWYAMFGAAIAVMATVFCQNGLYDTRVDAGIYADQMRLFASDAPYAASHEALVRIYKPLYAVVGGWLLHADPYAFILVANILLYLGLVPLSFLLWRLLGFGRREAVVGTLWLAAAYPLMKYGLALGTDISGWSFSVLTLVLGLEGLKRGSLFWLCLASLAGFVGATAQEVGALGLITLALLAAWQSRRGGLAPAVKRLAALALPAAALYGLLIMAVASQASVFSRYGLTAAGYGTGYHTLISWAVVEGSAFHILWVLAAAGIYMLIVRRRTAGASDRPAIAGYLIAAAIATVPVLLWPIFVSRILFIQFLWVIPLALIGLEMAPRRAIFALAAAAPIAVSLLLFLLSSGGSLWNGVKPLFGV